MDYQMLSAIDMPGTSLRRKLHQQLVKSAELLLSPYMTTYHTWESGNEFVSPNVTNLGWTHQVLPTEKLIYIA